MIVEYGTQCPAYDCWTCGTDRYGIDHCNYCDGCKAHLAVGVECGYSQKPNCVPKFKVGQKVYRFFHLDSYNQAVIRKVEWDGKFQWEYTFQRERTPYPENRVFATRQEIDTYVIEKHARRLLKELQEYAEEYHIPLENLKKKMIEQK